MHTRWKKALKTYIKTTVVDTEENVAILFDSSQTYCKAIFLERTHLLLDKSFD